jgi:cyclic beta-1,2-glucan synthetase
VTFRTRSSDLPVGSLHGPSARLLSNGSLTTLVTGDGTGFSQFGWRRVTGWTPDAVEDPDGSFLYLRDEESGRLWSVGSAPVTGSPRHYRVSSEPGLVRIERVEDEIEAVCEITVAADAHVELRRLRLRNLGARARRLSVTSCLPVVLHHPGAHAGHPAFSKLFVQTRVDAAGSVLLARRRLREPTPEELHLAHALFGDGAASWETDRARFFGRGGSPARPAAMAPGVALSGTVGSVLDPIASWRRTLVLAPDASAELLFVLAVAPSEEAAHTLALASAAAGTFDTARDAAARRAQAELARCGLEPGQGAYLEALLARMLYGVPSLRADDEIFRRVRGTPDDLWMLGLPPDQPLVAIEPGPAAGALARELARAIDYWSGLGVAVRGVSLGGETGDAKVVLAPKPDVPPRALDAARACARLVLRADWPDLGVERASAPARATAVPATHGRGAAPASLAGDPELLLENGKGGFARDGREYVLRIPRGASADDLPPMPWVNVLANPTFGTIVSERGAANTWHGNSREHRLTPWSNDPIFDPHGEALWVRDEDAGEFWSPQPGPTPGDGPYEIRHGFGRSAWRHESRELAHEVTTIVAPDAPVKLTRVRLTNRSARSRHLSVFAYARLVLGGLPEDIAHATVVDAADEGRALYATNGLAGAFAANVAFAAAIPAGSPAGVAHTADRRSFLGARGTPARPRALVEDPLLDGRSGSRLDPCFAHQVRLEIPAGESAECTFLLGEAEGRDAAQALVARFARPGAFAEVQAAVDASWASTFGALQVRTPSPALDVLVNGWLPYQTLACRLWARSAFYQSGGAFGFRDQLQDAASVVLLRPELTRAQILLHAAHQFVEGDVLHWWHPPLGRGTRTRFSDDLLWLPWVTAQYVATTGDASVLDERVGFVTARTLEPGEDEAYLPTEPAGEEATVFEHCCRAIERSLAVGVHGIPLMGTGDWNDGMNRVGREGRGESVWMAFFLFDVLRGFEPLCIARGEGARADRYAAHRASLAAAVEANAWDGAWYQRAWFDDGSPLGVAAAEECRIDALPQAWAVLSGAAPRARCETAMDSVERELVLPEGRLLRLLTPPFDRAPHDPGYIKGYVPGIRENGGQYTHAATWAVRATAALGRRDRALALLEMILPALHATTPEAVATYQVEPYVVSADVYAVAPHVGRGGWTWYTGSSGWLYRVAVESVLGLRLEAGRRFVLRPCIPDAWPEFRIELALPRVAARYFLHVRNPHGVAARVVRVVVDGVAIAPEDGAAVWAAASDGARHAVEIELGPDVAR